MEIPAGSTAEQAWRVARQVMHPALTEAQLAPFKLMFYSGALWLLGEIANNPPVDHLRALANEMRVFGNKMHAAAVAAAAMDKMRRKEPTQ